MEPVRRAAYKKSFKAQELNSKRMFLLFLSFIAALQPYSGIVEVSKSHTDTPHSVFYWTSDQPVAETCA